MIPDSSVFEGDMVVVHPEDLDNTMTLVGECGGLSSIIGDCGPSDAMPGLYRIETEHGALYLDPEEEVAVLL